MKFLCPTHSQQHFSRLCANFTLTLNTIYSTGGLPYWEIQRFAEPISSLPFFLPFEIIGRALRSEYHFTVTGVIIAAAATCWKLNKIHLCLAKYCHKFSCCTTHNIFVWVHITNHIAIRGKINWLIICNHHEFALLGVSLRSSSILWNLPQCPFPSNP